MDGYVGQSAAVGNAPWWGVGGGLLGGGRFADFSSNAVRINAAARANAAGIENLLDQNQFEATNGNINECCNRTLDMQVNGEFRMSDRLRDIEREMAANARAAAECCCDAKLLATQNHAETLAAIADLKTSNVQRDLDAANRQLTESNIVNTLTYRCGCCPPTGASAQA